ncbi:MAG: HAD family phosphatase [Ruminococcus sp.]|nr:HAD family phosphatase [Ruminococcus sp.]
MLKAVLFDMDGLITDTEKLLSRFWCEAAAFYGYHMTPEHVLGIRSLCSKYSAPHLRSIFGEDFDYPAVRAKRIELMDDYISKNGIEAKAGLYELLDYIKQSGLKCAVCTATDSQRTRRYLSSINALEPFDELVCGDMIKNGKPDPDTYLEGAAKLGFLPNECAALEDSPNGIESAYRAGCIPIMVPDLSQPDEELKAKVYAVCDSLADVTDVLDKLLRL